MLSPPHPPAVSRAMDAKMAQAMGPTARQARWREVRDFQMKTMVGKSRQR